MEESETIMSNQKIADRISAMIAKAESSTHPEEAATFMAMVHKMLEEHGMSMLDVGTLNSDDPVGHKRRAGKFYASESSFRDTAFSLAEYYGCTAYISVMGNHRYITVIGRESARITFELMWPYVKKCIRAEARRLTKEEGSTFARQQRWVADALTHRIDKILFERRYGANAPQDRGVNALVPVDVINAYCKEHFAHAKTVRDRDLQSSSAARAAADNIGLDVQMSSAATRKIGKA